MRSTVVGCKSLLLCCLLLVIVSNPAWAGVSGEITEVKMEPDGKALVISVKGEAGKHVARVLGRPNRLVIDFHDTRIGKMPHKIRASQGSIHEIRVGSYKGRARIVVDYQRKPVPAFNVNRSKDRVAIVFGKSFGTRADSGMLKKGTSAHSSPAPNFVPVAATAGSNSSQVQTPATRPVSMGSESRKKRLASLTSKGTAHVPAPPARVSANNSATARVSPGKSERVQSRGVNLAQSMQINRPASSLRVRGSDPGSPDSERNAVRSESAPSSNTSQTADNRRMVREVRPPVTPPTPDPRLLVQEITELKFIQVGHNSRLLVRGGDHLDYRLTKVSPTKLKIDLINAEIPKLHQKPLRTDLFSTSVEMIVPGSQTIFVQLKDAVPHQIEKKKGVLMIDFPPPRFAMTSDQKAVAGGDQQRREGMERGVRAAQARREAARILKEEQLRLQSETREKQIRNLLKEQDNIRQEMREIEKKYRVTPDPEVFSKPITMDFQGISLKNAFRLLAEQAGVNLIVGPQVEGSVTMRLFHVPLGQVIDQILKANGLERELIGNVIRIDKSDAIQGSKDSRSKQYEEEIKSTRRKLERNKGEIKRLEKEREKGLQELRNMEARVEEEAPEEITSVETIGETQKIEIEGEAVTFVLVRIKLSYVTPSKLKPILECVFNQKCEGVAGAASQPLKDKREERRVASELEKQGFNSGWGGTDARLERLRREQRANRRLKAQEQMAAGREGQEAGPGLGLAGGIDSRMEKILAHTIIWANDEYRMLFIKDLPERIEEMKKLISSMDIPKPQVLIESRLVQADRSWGRGLGIVWGGRNNQQGYLRNGSKNAIWGMTGGYTSGLNNPSLSDRPARISTDLCDSPCGRSPVGGGDILSTPVVNLPASVAGLDNLLGLGIQFGLVGNNFATDLDVRLQLGEANSKAKVIARPKVQVLDGETAEIKNGRQIAYSSVSADGTQVQLVSVDLKLEVKPKIFPDGRIEMEVKVSDNDVGDIVNGLASILTREAETTMIVMDGETAVIGGILRKTDNVGHQGWPGLMHVPVLSYLFGSKSRAKRVTELLVFITPTIVKRPPSAS